MSTTNGEGRPPAPQDVPEDSPRPATTSLQATAAMNAGLQHESSRRSSNSSISRNRSSPQTGRRRSAVLMNLQLNDPSIPAPGEMIPETHTMNPPFHSGSPSTVDPHHHRAPSLGELHQELEAEQEAHVNRLLQMIRQQQLELQRLQASHPHHSHGAEDSSAIMERSNPSTPQVASFQGSGPGHSSTSSISRSGNQPHPRSSFDMARTDIQRRSRTPSRGASPRMRSGSISAESGDWVLAGRDESAFYQAETQMLVRENQMLRHRVRDLEKQLSETSITPTSLSDPPVSSQLQQSATTEEIADGGSEERS